MFLDVQTVDDLDVQTVDDLANSITTNESGELMKNWLHLGLEVNLLEG